VKKGLVRGRNWEGWTMGMMKTRRRKGSTSLNWVERKKPKGDVICVVTLKCKPRSFKMSGFDGVTSSDSRTAEHREDKNR
jgi:hypothetical protein